MVKPDFWIKREALRGMISPFLESSVKPGVMSFGLSSYGYDFTLSEEFKIFIGKRRLDPKKPYAGSFKDYTGKSCRIPAHGFILGRSAECFRIPRNVLAICFGKSSYARAGITIHVTPLEPEWEGHITIMIANLSPAPGIVYANEGIGQVIFLGASSTCRKSYADKKGKYQNSRGIVVGK